MNRRGRPSLPPEQLSAPINARLKPEIVKRMKVLCFRRSVQHQRPFSEGAFFTAAIAGTALPRPPTPQQIAAYLHRWPRQRRKVDEARAIVLPRPTSY